MAEVYGPDSRCFEHEWMKDEDGRMMMAEGAGCYTVTCTSEEVIITIGDEAVTCSNSGEQVGWRR